MERDEQEREDLPQNLEEVEEEILLNLEEIEEELLQLLQLLQNPEEVEEIPQNPEEEEEIPLDPEEARRRDQDATLITLISEATFQTSLKTGGTVIVKDLNEIKNYDPRVSYQFFSEKDNVTYRIKDFSEYSREKRHKWDALKHLKNVIAEAVGLDMQQEAQREAGEAQGGALGGG